VSPPPIFAPRDSRQATRPATRPPVGLPPGRLRVAPSTTYHPVFATYQPPRRIPYSEFRTLYGGPLGAEATVVLNKILQEEPTPMGSPQWVEWIWRFCRERKEQRTAQHLTATGRGGDGSAAVEILSSPFAVLPSSALSSGASSRVAPGSELWDLNAAFDADDPTEVLESMRA
jgi:hypothetical protein